MQKFDKHIQIENRIISESTNTFIVAEAGVNHNGNIELAKEMIDAAVESGVDAVKFQFFKTDMLILKHVEKASYQKTNAYNNETQYDMLKDLELTKKCIKNKAQILTI